MKASAPKRSSIRPFIWRSSFIIATSCELAARRGLDGDRRGARRLDGRGARGNADFFLQHRRLVARQRLRLHAARGGDGAARLCAAAGAANTGSSVGSSRSISARAAFALQGAPGGA